MFSLRHTQYFTWRKYVIVVRIVYCSICAKVDADDVYSSFALDTNVAHKSHGCLQEEFCKHLIQRDESSPHFLFCPIGNYDHSYWKKDVDRRGLCLPSLLLVADGWCLHLLSLLMWTFLFIVSKFHNGTHLLYSLFLFASFNDNIQFINMRKNGTQTKFWCWYVVITWNSEALENIACHIAANKLNTNS